MAGFIVDSLRKYRQLAYNSQHMNNIGIIHYNFRSKSLDDFLEFAKETGFHSVELSLDDVTGGSPENFERNAERVLQRVYNYGLSISAVGMIGNDFLVDEPEEIKTEVERMKDIARIARSINCGVIRTEAGSPKESIPKNKWAEIIAECISRCLGAAEKNDVKYALDNHGLVSNDAELQLEIFRRLDSPRVGANLDTMNYRWFGYAVDELSGIYQKIAPWTFHTHIKDGTGVQKNYQGEALGDGEVPISQAITSLRDAGYNGVYCIEYEGNEPVSGYGGSYSYLKKMLEVR